MTKVSRRDFLKLILVALGTFILYFLGKRSEPAPSVPTQTPTSVPFSFWGQSNLSLAVLNMPFHDLR